MDIYEFCRGPHAKVGKYSGNTRDFEEENARDNEELPDFLEAWGDDPDSEYHDDDFEHYANFRIESYTNQIGPENIAQMKLYCGGQSHKDLAWRWRFQQTKRKTINTYRKAIEHWKMYPSYTFVSSQPTLLEWVRELDPKLFEDLKDMAKAGNFDLAGGLMNECDCRIPSGEAIVRQRLYGQLYYLEHFGKISDVEWMPDTFGWCNTLPQLIRKSGSSCFYTTKLGNNDTSTFPFSYFRWRSPDGSELISSYQGHQFNMLGQLGRLTHTARMVKSGETLVGSCSSPDDLTQSPLLADEVFPIQIFYAGAGDGKSGPMGQEVAEMRKMIEKGFLVGWSTAHEHFAKAKEFQDRMPVWDDELYYEFHRGTLTTQHLVKRMNRKLENLLVTLENLASCLAMTGAIEYPYDVLTQAWHVVLLIQFHDVLPGSSIPEVYDDCYEYWQKCSTALVALLDVLLGGLNRITHPSNSTIGDLGSIFVFNPLGYPTALGLVEVPFEDANEPPNSIIDASGRKVPVVYLKSDPQTVDPLDRKAGRLVFKLPVPLPAMGVASFGLSSDSPVSVTPPPLWASEDGNRVEVGNSKIRVTVSRTTNEVVVYKRDGPDAEWGDPVAGGNLRVFEDKPAKEPCWNIQPEYRDQEISVPPGEVVLEKSPENGVLAEILITRTLNKSKLSLTLRVFNNLPVIFMELLADWHEQDMTMRFEWIHELGTKKSTSESPYGFCERATVPKGPYDIARWELYGQSWAHVTTPAGEEGISIFNEGKYGFDARDNRLGLTLLRGPEYPTPDSQWIVDERKRRQNQDGKQPPTHADQGVSIIRFGLLLFGNELPENITANQVAHEFNRPPLVSLQGANLPSSGDLIDLSGSKNASFGFFGLDVANVELTTVKRAEQDPTNYVIRLVEMSGIPETRLTLSFAPILAQKIKSIVECDLLERESILDDAKPEWRINQDGSGECALVVKKCEIVSLLLKCA